MDADGAESCVSGRGSDGVGRGDPGRTRAQGGKAIRDWRVGLSVKSVSGDVAGSGEPVGSATETRPLSISVRVGGESRSPTGSRVRGRFDGMLVGPMVVVCRWVLRLRVRVEIKPKE